MRAFPLLDLDSAWKDARQVLTEIAHMAETLFEESERTWLDMQVCAAKAQAAREALGDLPPGVVEGIAKDQEDLQEMEDRADAASY